MSIGYKNVPVTILTQRGPLSTVVGLTYVRDNGELQIWDSWINPTIAMQLDAIDQTTCIAEAARKFLSVALGRRI